MLGANYQVGTQYCFQLRRLRGVLEEARWGLFFKNAQEWRHGEL